MTPTLWLSCHVGYACRHSGACCRAGWPLPVETRTVAAIDRAVQAGALATADRDVIWLQPTIDAPDDVAGTFRLVEQACVFNVESSDGAAAGDAPRRPRSADTTSEPGMRHCAVHAALGHGALPSTCQHFPRVCLVDARGVRVSLSHFCPTAASMLVDDDRPVTIVTGPPAAPGLEVPEGLDARDTLPPRLSSRVLADLDGLTAWEAHVVGALAGPDAWPGEIDAVLAALATQASTLAAWTPAAGSLGTAVRALARPHRSVGHRAAFTSDAAWALGAAACRTPWTWAPRPADLATIDARLVAPGWGDAAPVVRRYLAGKAFGAWVTYQADAAVALVAWLQLAATVLRVECARAAGAAARPLDRAVLVEAVREADRNLVHLADGARLAAAVAAHECH